MKSPCKDRKDHNNPVAQESFNFQRIFILIGFSKLSDFKTALNFDRSEYMPFDANKNIDRLIDFILPHSFTVTILVRKPFNITHKSISTKQTRFKVFYKIQTTYIVETKDPTDP